MEYVTNLSEEKFNSTCKWKINLLQSDAQFSERFRGFSVRTCPISIGGADVQWQMELTEVSCTDFSEVPVHLFEAYSYRFFIVRLILASEKDFKNDAFFFEIAGQGIEITQEKPHEFKCKIPAELVTLDFECFCTLKRIVASTTEKIPLSSHFGVKAGSQNLPAEDRSMIIANGTALEDVVSSPNYENKHLQLDDENFFLSDDDDFFKNSDNCLPLQAKTVHEEGSKLDKSKKPEVSGNVASVNEVTGSTTETLSGKPFLQNEEDFAELSQLVKETYSEKLDADMANLRTQLFMFATQVSSNECSVTLR